MLSSAVVLNPQKTIFRPAQKSPGRLQGVGATRARKQGSASQASHLLFTTHTPQVGSSWPHLMNLPSSYGWVLFQEAHSPRTLEGGGKRAWLPTPPQASV